MRRPLGPAAAAASRLRRSGRPACFNPQVPIRAGLASAEAFTLARDVLGSAGGRFRRQPEGETGLDAVTFYKSVGTAVQARWSRAGAAPG